jgi:hypothetical protein
MGSLWVEGSATDGKMSVLTDGSVEKGRFALANLQPLSEPDPNLGNHPKILNNIKHRIPMNKL